MPTLKRRRLLQAGLAAASLPLLPPLARAAAAPLREIALVAGPAQATLQAGAPATAVWAYGGHAPGPEIRVALGTHLRVTLTNKLDRPTSLHFQGLRLPNALDGVAGLTQKPVMPSESFTYAFVARDAGTYWYRPEAGDAEQQPRGMAGALVVEDKEPIKVDRDLVWVLQDWRLDDEGVQIADFDRATDLSGQGRPRQSYDHQWPAYGEFPRARRRAGPPASHQRSTGAVLRAQIRGSLGGHRRL